jgi:hypothetical protein
LLGSETGLDSILAQVLKTIAPNFKIITQQQAASLINRNELAAEYTRMRNEALQSHLLDRGSLKKLGTAIGTRYVFQPKLIEFMQITKDRWEIPPIALKISRIRSSIMRLSLQLWDMQTGELLWSSLVEASLESEAVGQDPIYFEDTARVAMGSIITDFMDGKTASSYGPLDTIIDQLIEIPQPEKRKSTDNREHMNFKGVFARLCLHESHHIGFCPTSPSSACSLLGSEFTPSFGG